MPDRELLPTRRQNWTEVFDDSNGIRMMLTVGLKPNGDIGEIFLNAGRSNSALDVLLSDAAIIVSIALQYGVPLRQLAHGIKRDARGVAASPIGAAIDRISIPEVLP
jgi:hypothetical protein